MRYSLIFIGIFLVVGCEKKDPAGKEADAIQSYSRKVMGNMKDELGFIPQTLMFIDLKAIRNSPLMAILKNNMTKFKSDSDCMSKIFETADTIELFSDNSGTAIVTGKNMNQPILAFYRGVDPKETETCIQKTYPIMAKGKLWAVSDNVLAMATGKFAEKIVPGKGKLGKGIIDSSMKRKSLMFLVEGDESLPIATGYIDLSNGLALDWKLKFNKELEAKSIESQFNRLSGALKLCPRRKDLVEKIKFIRRGDLIIINTKLSRYELRQLTGLMRL
ncbi:hypothetical protein KKF34_16105 [Myxococcota bacterium]|nr:hypothetical protein [Myxococcota bacterium]MBU1382723.1 hypothetical protein [Myxococcota bacterium]MBU1498400.1 hypothetical protein [Myxococcota bacterium]